MGNMFLYQEIDNAFKFISAPDVPSLIRDNLAQHIELREYQEKAFQHFLTYYENDKLSKNKQIHTLFHMATGSGKTIIMAGLILYLYSKGYRNFLFFVNRTSIIAKTRENFLNTKSNKYLFSDEIQYLGNKIRIKEVDNFQSTSPQNEDINICFMSIQGLHRVLTTPKENSLTIQDFEDNKVVFISDESHHVNTWTKKPNKDETRDINSWEYSVMRAFYSNRNNVLLEFTATANLEDKNVKAKYLDKIVFNYTLKEFRKSGYTKDFQNFATDSDHWNRTLMALVLSEYRRYLFTENNLNIKPVIMLKSQRIKDSENFYEEFFKKVKNLTAEEIRNLQGTDMLLLKKAIDYFINKDSTLELLVRSIQNSFVEECSIIMNGSSDDNDINQVLVNTLEDENNPIRIVFAVDMLNEGWDVLNLFDIVRLYDRRDGRNGKPGRTTISEAQLIGRGARYCPFKVLEEDERFKRKYDEDMDNKYRILETMLYHSKYNSRYISELKQALIDIGMEDEQPIKRTYKLKESFKDTKIFKQGLIYSNKRVKKDRQEIESIEGKFKYKSYSYSVPSKSSRGYLVNLFGDEKIETKNTSNKIVSIKDIDYSIVLGASERFLELKFNILYEKYPHIKNLKEFFTGDNYLGNAKIEFEYYKDEGISGIDYYNALREKVFPDVANHISSIKPGYEGSKEFYPVKISEVLRDKTIRLSSVRESGGYGESQNECSNPDYRLDLGEEKWYVFNDNYGTSEEKIFMKYFKNVIAPKLDKKKLEYYVIRNERVPEFVIYSFKDGERFEPDFLLLARKHKLSGDFETEQVYIEPKGNLFLETDEWKEEFLLDIENKYKLQGILVNGDYNVIGMPFFNKDNKMEEFEQAIDNWIDKI
jgi:type III restriction enzyme